MMSMNQLSVQVEDFEESKGFNVNSLKKGNSLINTSLFDNQSNSRQLFRKCKKIIQQQMIQINNLSQQNQKLSTEIDQYQQETKEKQTQILRLTNQNDQTIKKNEILHKQISKLKKSIEDITKQFQGKQSMIKLKQNKIQLLQDNLKKTMIQKNTLEEKCQVLEQTVKLLKKQLNKAQEIIGQKQNEMRFEIQQLKRVKMILERNNKVENLDSVLLFNDKSFKEDKFKLSNGNNEKLICRPYFTVQEESPFHKVNLKHQLSTYQKTHYDQSRKSQYYSAQLTRDPLNKSNAINPFYITEQRQNTSPVSRIRKNISKPKNHYDTQIHNTSKTSVSKSKPKENLSGKLSNSKNTSFLINTYSQLSNPQISQELSNIKEQILQQYTKMQIKKGLISHERINQTLQQIQNKLQKMAKISAIDQSQSQFQ